MFIKNYKIIFTSLILVVIFTSKSFGLIDNWYHYEQGLRMIAAKNYDQAQKEFNYYLRHPDMHRHMFGVAYFGRGLMFQETGDVSRAIEQYQMATMNDLHPSVRITDKAYVNIGTIYMQRKAYTEAISAYSKAIESNPKNGFAHYYLGLALYEAGEYEKAAEEAETAKKLEVPFTALSDKLNEAKDKTKPARAGKAKE